MTKVNTEHFIQKSGNYGLQEFMEIMGELSQESTKKDCYLDNKKNSLH